MKKRLIASVAVLLFLGVVFAGSSFAAGKVFVYLSTQEEGLQLITDQTKINELAMNARNGKCAVTAFGIKGFWPSGTRPTFNEAMFMRTQKGGSLVYVCGSAQNPICITQTNGTQKCCPPNCR